jgi:hypothetical protein
MNNLEIINRWFESECNGDWETENQIKIETVSNPGWDITIDVRLTPLIFQLAKKEYNASSSDWYFYELTDAKFTASGDMSKLDFLLGEFVQLIRAAYGSLPGL